MEQNSIDENGKNLPFTQNNHKVDTVKNQYIHKEVNVKAPSVLPVFFQKVKEYIGLFMVVWGGLSTIFTTLIVLWLWYYLSNINSTDLFLESVASVNTIALVLITSFLLALITLGISFPSAYIFGLSTMSYKDKKPPLELLVPYLIPPFIFLACFVALLGLINSLLWLFLLGLIVVASTFLIKIKKGHNRVYFQILESLESSKKGADMFGICLFIIISCWLSLVPLLFLNDLWIYQIEGFFASLIFVLCIWLGYIPGATLLLLLHYKQPSLKITVIVISVIIVVAILVMGIFPIKIRTTIFKSTGIYNENEQVFLFLDSSMKCDIF